MYTQHVSAWGWFWLTWMLTGAGVEIYWVFVRGANTLSRQIWGLEGLNISHPLDFAAWTWAHWAISLALWTFFAWLSVHFPFGWLR